MGYPREGDNMKIHVILAKFTQNGNKTTPERLGMLKGICKQVENAGAKILNLYEHMGSYDIVVVIEIPDSLILGRIENALLDSHVITSMKVLGPYPLARHSFLDSHYVTSA